MRGAAWMTLLAMSLGPGCSSSELTLPEAGLRPGCEPCMCELPGAQTGRDGEEGGADAFSGPDAVTPDMSRSGDEEESCPPGLAGADCELCVEHVDLRSTCEEACGGGWTRAWPALQDGIEAAAERAPCEVWVAAGEYLPTLGEGRGRSFHMREGVALYGGFRGQESVREARDHARLRTVLSGDLGTPGDRSDNAYHVLHGADDARLDGFVVTGGQADDPTLEPERSSNGYNHHDANGGGILLRGVSPTIAHCLFTDNRATYVGGAVSIVYADPHFEHCQFVDNEAHEAGAVMVFGGDPSFQHSRFALNRADSGGAMYTYGGTPMLEDGEFVDNEAQFGGALYNRWANPRIHRVRFARNTANQCAAVSTTYTGTVQVYESTFIDNRAAGDGGAFCSDSRTVVRNSLFVGNHSGGYGGALLDTHGEVRSSTFVGNRAALGGGAFGHRWAGGPLQVTGSIFWDNGAEPIRARDGLRVHHSLVEGGCTSGGEEPCTPDDTGNLDADPRFVQAPSFGDDGALEPDFDLRLKADSPCVDAADPDSAPAHDLAGSTRDDAPDMGAYELVR